MFTRNIPPAYGLSGGPISVACQWNMSSPTGPNVLCQPKQKLKYKLFVNCITGILNVHFSRFLLENKIGGKRGKGKIYMRKIQRQI